MQKQHETFTEFIKLNEGFILSSGTHKADTLCALSYDLLCRIIDLYENKPKRTPMDDVNLAHAIIVHNELKKLFGFEHNHNTSEAYEKVFYNEITIDEQLANDIFNEDVFELFNVLSPNNYSFGTSESDGALFGWFEANDY